MIIISTSPRLTEAVGGVINRNYFLLLERRKQEPAPVQACRFWWDKLQTENYAPSREEINRFCTKVGVEWTVIRSETLTMVSSWRPVFETSIWGKLFLYKPFILKNFHPYTSWSKGKFCSTVKQIINHLRSLESWKPEARLKIVAEAIGRVMLGPSMSRKLPLRAEDLREAVEISKVLEEIEAQLEPFFGSMTELPVQGELKPEEVTIPGKGQPLPSVAHKEGAEVTHPTRSETSLSSKPRPNDRKKKERVDKGPPPPIPRPLKTMGKRPPISLRARKTPETELVSLSSIVGVVKNPHWIDADFRPKPNIVNKRFRKVWMWVHSQSRDRQSFDSDSILLARVEDDKYFVVEGLRRVIALKHLTPDTKEIKARVMDFRDVYQKSMERKSSKPNKTETYRSSRAMFRPSPIMRAPTNKERDRF